jgi:hypothetical protein
VLVKFIEEDVTNAQISYGGNCDPVGLLELGRMYEVDYADVRSSRTSVYLKGFPGKSFNSVWFDIDDVCKLPQRQPDHTTRGWTPK